MSNDYYVPPDSKINFQKESDQEPTVISVSNQNEIKFKYKEKEIVEEIAKYLKATYGEHYKAEDSLECFDAWIALGDSSKTFINTALKYLWRYGKKENNNKKDLLKAIHYILMCMYVDHYKEKK